MRPLLTAVALLLGTQLSSGAGEEFQADSLELCEVVVTATRTPKTLKDVPVATRVISAADIARTDASDIKELLTEELPGLEFSFAMGQETTLSMNGFGGNAILFLVDGERLAGETMDNVDYNRLNLGGVGRVEIVRGAASALYGANAVGGVVNLISKENTAPWHLSLDTRYGSEGDRWRSGGELSFNTSRWNSTTTLRHSRASAVRLTSAFDTRSAIHEIYGGTVSDIRERLVFRASDRLRFIARAGAFRRVSNRTNHDDRYDDISAGLRAVWTPGSRQNLEVSCAYDRYDKARYTGETRTNDHDYSNRQTSRPAIYTRLFGSNGLTAGADVMHDRLAT
ncbi:MAG: TonB-dependent receptor plug domain-containing protein, partial [Duncaniella sp.]|nr:TonB-dependent receptor plug domain-containing protein [Duncaniella sp.]